MLNFWVGFCVKYQTNLVSLQNFANDTKETFGFYKPKCFMVTEDGFDKAILIRFKHSQKLKDEIYVNVVDEWYEPAIGGNSYYGFSMGYFLKKANITSFLGKIISLYFKTSFFHFHCIIILALIFRF